MVRSKFFLSVLALLIQYSEVDCEENKHDVRLFDNVKIELAKICFLQGTSW